MLKWLSGILTTVLSGWVLHDRLLHRLRSWSWHFLNSDISQGSVVTQLRCGEIISQGFVANLLVNLPVKEVWKSVNIWRSYGQYCSALFFWLTVYKELDGWVFFIRIWYNVYRHAACIRDIFTVFNASLPQFKVSAFSCFAHFRSHSGLTMANRLIILCLALLQECSAGNSSDMSNFSVVHIRHMHIF